MIKHQRASIVLLYVLSMLIIIATLLGTDIGTIVTHILLLSIVSILLLIEEKLDE